MKSKRAEKLRKRKARVQKRERRIIRQLKSRGRCAQDHPVFGGRMVEYEVADRTIAVGAGGVGAIHGLVQRVGLAGEIDRTLHVLKQHQPYHESDHVLNIAYNVLCGGRCLEDLEQRRHDEGYLRVLGARRAPDPTTAADFCRRCGDEDVEAIMQAIDESRLRIWSIQPDSFFDKAVIDVDGTIVETTGECKEGMDLSYNGKWGYHPQLISLANTGEPLCIENRSGNRRSDDGAAIRLDDAIDLCHRAGFRRILLRGDTAFSQSQHLDRWNVEGVSFVFGYPAKENLPEIAKELPETAWRRLDRPQPVTPREKQRKRLPRVKEGIVKERGYKNIVLENEWVAEFDYQPVACKRAYRMVVVRKDLEVLQGQELLFPEIRYLFYITNLSRMSASKIVFTANKRCAQEKLIDQLKNQVHALRSPVGNLTSNWAYMVIASLAWTLKAWMALSIPATGRWARRRSEDRRQLLTMSFRTFVEEMIRVPAQILTTGRQVICRLLSWTRHQSLFFRVVEALEVPMRC